MAFKMKGSPMHRNFGIGKAPLNQKSDKQKAADAAELAAKTFAYDSAEEGTARADSLGGSYTEANSEEFNRLFAAAEKSRNKSNKEIEKSNKKINKANAKNSPTPQKRANKKVDRANKAVTKANTYMSDNMTTYDDEGNPESGYRTTDKKVAKKANRLVGRADRKGAKASKAVDKYNKKNS